MENRGQGCSPLPARMGAQGSKRDILSGCELTHKQPEGPEFTSAQKKKSNWLMREIWVCSTKATQWVLMQQNKDAWKSGG